MFLLTPKLQALKEPALDLLNNVYTELRKLAGELITQIAVKAPAIMDEMINEADAFLLSLKSKAEEILIANIESEISYIFTNDEDYLEERTKLIPSKDEPTNPKKKDAGEPAEPKRGNLSDTKQDRENLKKEAEKMFVRELRKRVDHYFRITVRTLRVFFYLI